MELSVALGLPLTDALRRTTNRQFAAWRRWLSDRWNRPDRTDHYLMQVAAEVRRNRVKNPESVGVSDLMLPFVEAAPKPPASSDEAARRSKLVWGAILRDVPVVKTEPGGGSGGN